MYVLLYTSGENFLQFMNFNVNWAIFHENMDQLDPRLKNKTLYEQYKTSLTNWSV